MKVNITKTEGLRLGRLRRSPVPAALANDITWCPGGSFIISLGIPIGNNFDERAFWLSQYFKCKRIVARLVRTPRPHSLRPGPPC